MKKPDQTYSSYLFGEVGGILFVNNNVKIMV